MPETRTKLRYIIRQKVINDQTTQTISLGLKYAGVTDGSVPPWPGHKCKLDRSRTQHDLLRS